MDNKIILSLTTYGERINTVYLTIETLLNQTKKADKIILWLAEDEFNRDNLPSTLKEQEKLGLEIGFCKDIKSYKKLIPTLKKHPNDIIVTFDDDLLYRLDTLEKLYDAYLNDPKCIHCIRGRKIKSNILGELQSYNKWKNSFNYFKASYKIIPIGVGGVLYPVNCFYKDILKEDLFMTLAPRADDIWFKAMTFKNGFKCKIVKQDKKKIKKLNYIDGTQEKSLFNSNKDEENGNNPQIKSVFGMYNIMNVKSELKYDFKVSVIVPVYNVEKYLKECLDSVANQSLENIEIICIDDCSPDNSIKIIKDYMKKDNRIKVISHKSNLGLGGARNTGIENAKGEYIFFLDSDDKIDSKTLEKLYNTAKEQNANVVCCDIEMFYDDGTKKAFKNSKKRIYGWNKLKPKNFETLNRIAWNKLYNNEIFKNKEIRFTNHLIHEDIEFYWKCFLNYPKAFVIKEKLYFYRQRENSIMSQKKPDTYFGNHAYILKSIYKFLKSNNLYMKYRNDFHNRFKYFIKLAKNSSTKDFDFFIENLNEDLKKIYYKNFNK